MLTNLAENTFYNYAEITFAYILAERLLVMGTAYFMLLSNFGRKTRVYRIPFSKFQIRKELLLAIPVFALDTLSLSAALHYGLIQISSPTFVNVTLTFLAQFFWFEFWFYATHRAMHHKSLYWIHREHHTAHVTQPLTALSFGLVERCSLLIGFFIPYIISSHYFQGVSYLALFLGIFVNFFLNTLGHSNFDPFPKGHYRSPFSLLLNSPTYHSMHHARFNKHFGLYTPWFDALFKTRYEDLEKAFVRVKEGHGLLRFNESFIEKSTVPQSVSDIAQLKSSELEARVTTSGDTPSSEAA